MEKKKILIVEDNELNLKLFNDLLEAHHYQAIPVREGDKVIALAHEHQPHLILMDIQLHGTSGLEIIKTIKANPQLQHIPVIAVTAYAMEEDEKRILEAGCEAYISKPISITPFLSIIEKFLTRE